MFVPSVDFVRGDEDIRLAYVLGERLTTCHYYTSYLKLKKITCNSNDFVCVTFPALCVPHLVIRS